MEKLHRLTLALGAVAIGALLAFPPAAGAEDGESGYVAVTTADPEIPLDEFSLHLLPLTRAELEIEAAAWMDLLQHKVRELSDAEIAAKYKRLEIKAAEEAAAAAREAQEAAEEAERAREEAAPGEGQSAEEVAGAEAEAEEAAEEALAALEEAAEVEKKVEEHEGAQEATQEATEAAVSEAAEEGEEAAAALEDDSIDATVIADAATADEEALGEVAVAVEEAAAAKEAVREEIFDRVAALHNERAGLTDRLRLVLDKLEVKGGDVGEMRSYLTAVSGIRIDVTDTRGTWKTLVGWLRGTEGGLRWMKNALRFIVILILSWFIGRLAGLLVERLLGLRRRFSHLMKRFLAVGVRWTIFALGAAWGLASLEVNVGPVVAVIGAAGFVLAFALQSSLSNIASGIMIMVFRPFDTGDVIEVSDVKGKVGSMNLVSTTVRTGDNQHIVIPNNKVWGNVITNVTGSVRRRVDMHFEVSHDSDVDRVARILREVVDRHPLVLQDPSPVVKLNELTADGLGFLCRPWVLTENYQAVFWDIMQSVKVEFDKEGIHP